MSRLSRDNIIDLENRVTRLDGEEPETHSGTIYKKELEDLDDRITVLEGEEPEVHNNEMRLSDISDFEERVEALEEEEPTPEPTGITVDLTTAQSDGSWDSGGIFFLVEDSDLVNEINTDYFEDNILELNLKLDSETTAHVIYVPVDDIPTLREKLNYAGKDHDGYATWDLDAGTIIFAFGEGTLPDEDSPSE